MAGLDVKASVGVRTVWMSPTGRYCLVAREWDDGAPASYGMMVQGPSGWAWCTSDHEHREARTELYRWLDQRKQHAD